MSVLVLVSLEGDQDTSWKAMPYLGLQHCWGSQGNEAGEVGRGEEVYTGCFLYQIRPREKGTRMKHTLQSYP